MTDEIVMPLSADLVIAVDATKALQLSESLEQAVNAIWQEEKQLRGDTLFDGQIFHAEEISVDCVSGYWIPYRYALAGYRNPVLAQEIGVLPVAVNGVARCKERYLLGLRSAAVSCFAGLWELAPCGGIDPSAMQGSHIDWRACLFSELEEETGISKSSVTKMEPWIAVIDRGLSALELCFHIELAEQAEQQLVSGSHEYTRFVWLSLQELRVFTQEAPMLPLSELLIARC